MSTQTRTSKVLGIVLSVTLAFSGIGTAFATQGGSSENSPLPFAPSAEDTGELEGSFTPEQSPSGENQDAGFSDGTKTPGSATNEALTGETSENGSEDSDIGIGSDKDVAGVAITAGAATQASPRAGNVTITDINQLKSFFPDPTFRTIVFAAVKNGQKNAVGTSVEDALANFTGNILAQGPYGGKSGHGMALINDIHGIQCLRNAGSVDFRFNNVEDLSFLARDDSQDEEGKGDLWYGGESDEGPNPNNVTWIMDGNPFKIIPEYFGGRLVIEQPASHFSSYPNDEVEIQSYVRSGRGDAPISGTLHIGKTKYIGHNEYIPIDKKSDSIKDSASSSPLTLHREQLGPDNSTIPFSGLLKSGRHTIVVGTSEVFAYGTNANLDYSGTGDGIWAVTPGAQSFKYYISPLFYVYDKVSIDGDGGGSITLTKTKEGEPATVLSGAEFNLYKGTAPNGKLIRDGLVTDANGQIKVGGLESGSYYFMETRAPAGYIINRTPIKAEVKLEKVTLSGGKTEVIERDGNTVEKTVTAAPGQVFIAGRNTDINASPDIKLTQGSSGVDSVQVTYTKLEDASNPEAILENVVRTFTGADALDNAQADINAEKNANRILGDVSIHVDYGATSGPSSSAVEVTASNKAQEMTEISGKKTWIDNKDWKGVRPEVKLHLLRDGVDTGKTATLEKSSPDAATASTEGVRHVPVNEPENQYSRYTFKDLPKYDPNDGHEYKYSVKENLIYITYQDPDEPSATLTNHYIPSSPNGVDITNTWPDGTLINIKGHKIWEDFNNADGKRPGHVVVELYQKDPTTVEGQDNPVKYGEYTTSVANGWEYHFDLLPKFVKDAQGKDTATAYIYTLKEVAVDGYVTNVDTVDTSSVSDKQDATADITNTFENNIVSVSGVKTWVDEDNASGKRPTGVVVELLQNGQPMNPEQKKTVTETGGWTYSFGNLPKYDTNGKEYVYTVQEEPVPYYSTEITGSAKEGVTITNTLIPLIEIPVTKKWVDNDGFTGTDPEVTIRLLQNGTKVDEATLSFGPGEKEKTYTFTDLPKTDAAGKDYQYTVEEDEPLYQGRHGYQPTITGNETNGFTITNTWTQEDLITISGEKLWKGDSKVAAQERPGSVKLVLYRDGVEYSHTTVTAAGGWKYSFKNLPKHKEGNLKEVSTYTIGEEAAAGYTSNLPLITVSEVENAQHGDIIGNKNITNVFNNTVRISGEKKWVDKDNERGIRPASVEVQLLQNNKLFKTTRASAISHWTYSFNGLPKYDPSGNLYAYTVDEKEVPGYVTKVYDTTITNTTIPLIEIPVTKVWENNVGYSGPNPDVTVHLWQNDKMIDTATIAAPADPTPAGWFEATYVFRGPKNEGLPKTDQAGVPYVYKVTEDEVTSDGRKGYTTTIFGDERTGFTIINDWTEREFISIAGKKSWSSDDMMKDAVRPSEVVLVLWRDGVEYRRLPVGAENNWEFKFGQLPKHKDGSNGAALSEYKITELPVEGYTSEPPEITTDEISGTADGSTLEGQIVTNTFVNETTVSGEKVWNDFHNASGKRPSSIEVELLQNGNPMSPEKKVTVTEADGWKYTFEGLPKYDDVSGEEYIYSVKEVAVPDYFSDVSSDTKEGFTITNTFNNNIVSVPVEKVWDDYDNVAEERPSSIEATLLQDGKPYGHSVTISEAVGWRYTFENLPKYSEAGEEFTYTVEEREVPESYRAEVTGNPTSGFLITNTLINKIDVAGTKVWDDTNAAPGMSHEPVEVELLRDGKPLNPAQKMTVSEDNRWTFSFTDLPKVNEDTHKVYEYTVQETDVPEGYEPRLTGSAKEGLTITNTWPTGGLITIVGEKKWVGDVPDDRPASVLLKLYRDGEEYDTATATAEEGWKFAFENLPKLKRGSLDEESVYTLKEVEVAGYKAALPILSLQGVEDGQTVVADVTNTKVPGVPGTPGTSRTGDILAKVVPTVLTLALLGTVGVIAAVRRMPHRASGRVVHKRRK
ncbi:Cna B-type domain-containing protein [Eggerthella sp. YY7918]|uniref:Cna B-type domain-containing protein n=1 Tax=Eggerthella sp. (strain YY7918) TaxID=502558 RepID=UPI0002170FF0|nr:Cna B-type domain-containing protein [Eggerthella sp. YY7918]BAK43353.1 hypothetical protein EGYY_00720 [Eggerthella sp. YY7918]